MVSGRTFKTVASMWRPVDPKGTQGRYIRSRTTLQNADRLRAHQTCMGDEMRNASGSPSDIRKQFANAAEKCAEDNDHDYSDDLPSDFEKKY